MSLLFAFMSESLKSHICNGRGILIENEGKVVTFVGCRVGILEGVSDVGIADGKIVSKFVNRSVGKFEGVEVERNVGNDVGDE